jgi:ABC-type branched-subunit amino acid transport system substrate-binding protein
MITWRRLRRWLDSISKLEVASLSMAFTLLAALTVAYPLQAPRTAGDDTGLSATGAGQDSGGFDSDAGSGLDPNGAASAAGGAGAGGNGSGAAGPSGLGGNGTGGGAGTTGTTRPGGPTVPLRATDQGVDATSVKVGFVINNLGGLQQSGYAQGLRGDARQVIQAYVDKVNATGGLSGRKVAPVIAEQDPLNANSVQAACVQLGEQDKVFGVVDPLSTDPCYALKYKLPHTTENLARRTDLLKRAPYEASTFINVDRSDVNWVHEAQAAGFFAKEYDGRPPVFGLLAHVNTEPGPGHVEQTLKPELDRAGVRIAAEYRITPNPAKAATEMAQAVFAMSQAGVTRMFLSVGFLDVANFLNQADGQNFFPKYFASDLGAHTQDFQAANFNPHQWDGTEGVTSTHSGQSAAGKPLSAEAKACSAILEAAGLPGIKDESDLVGITYCDTFFLLVAAARAVGPELTRKAWGQALQRLGPFPSAYSALSVFAPNKFDGGDKVARVRWKSSCRCWVQESDFKQGYA